MKITVASALFLALLNSGCNSPTMITIGNAIMQGMAEMYQNLTALNLLLAASRSRTLVRAP
jgi:hypothetical protein